MTFVEVDPGSPVPPFEQVRTQIAEAIRAGQLKPGMRLPTVRQLAGDVGLAPGTVARAYRALEEEHLVYGAGRLGTRVTDPAELPPSTRSELLTQAAARYVAEALRLGVTPEEAAAALHPEAG